MLVAEKLIVSSFDRLLIDAILRCVRITEKITKQYAVVYARSSWEIYNVEFFEQPDDRILFWSCKKWWAVHIYVYRNKLFKQIAYVASYIHKKTQMYIGVRIIFGENKILRTVIGY